MKREKELMSRGQCTLPFSPVDQPERWMTGCAPDEEEKSSRVGSSLPQPRGRGSDGSGVRDLRSASGVDGAPRGLTG